MAAIDLTGQTFDRLTVLEQAEPRHGKRRWLCRCTCGTEKVLDGSHLTSGATRSCGCLHRENLVRRNTAEVPTYIGLHLRLRTQRGPASNYLCDECQGQAIDWAYDHTDPSPIFEERESRGHLYVLPYSLDMDRYRPLCKGCHRRFDAGRAA